MSTRVVFGWAGRASVGGHSARQAGRGGPGGRWAGQGREVGRQSAGLGGQGGPAFGLLSGRGGRRGRGARVQFVRAGQAIGERRRWRLLTFASIWFVRAGRAIGWAGRTGRAGAGRPGRAGNWFVRAGQGGPAFSWLGRGREVGRQLVC
ncbi:hypothetical protein PPACK8108_LOCUS20755 [Phakopsora pachyrhizi]|uniref:Uncharacterized protein n=1 Tax=Phakopsora pachyrhizi TaxID=170000 RepID=A0AAV0BJ11_PHAPC|nr:hypothetical protein PPACK8108_LOCUS20755 [Phakopsora pachyrhizi]